MTALGAPAFALTVDEARGRIRERNPIVHALVRVQPEAALARDGIPFSLKDTWDVAGQPTCGGSHRYRDRVAPVSSPVYEVFRDAGGVLVGRSHCSDLTVSPESASWLGDATSHPRDRSRTAGGSSGGAAAAVADGMVAFDWGSDIGGSIRGPSAFCGVVGLRLSSETWPLVGFFPDPPEALRWMNGQGPIASTLAQVRALVDVAAPRLRTGPERPFRLRGAVIYAPDRSAAGQWPRFADEIAPLARAALGEVRLDHGLPSLLRARNLASAVWASHFPEVLASSGLRMGEGLAAICSALLLRGAFGDRRLHPYAARMLALMALGKITLFFDRRRALARAAAYRDAVRSLWDEGYVLLAPTCTISPPRHGRSIYHPRAMALTFAGNLADATGLAVPLGEFEDGFPRSLQILGPPGSEHAVLDAGERMAAAFRAARQPAPG